TPTSMVAGGVPWGMAAALSTQGVRVSAFDVDAEGGAHSLEAPLRVAAGKSLVAVVRDLHRRLAQREAIDSLLGSRPDAVVVEMGLPLCRPGGAMAYIATNGSARVCAEAAAEDDRDLGRDTARDAGIGPRDAVVGISASGGTAYVLGALDRSASEGALQVAITCHPGSPLGAAVDIAIEVDTGPEVIAGSTR